MIALFIDLYNRGNRIVKFLHKILIKLRFYDLRIYEKISELEN